MNKVMLATFVRQPILCVLPTDIKHKMWVSVPEIITGMNCAPASSDTFQYTESERLEHYTLFHSTSPLAIHLCVWIAFSTEWSSFNLLVGAHFLMKQCFERT